MSEFCYKRHLYYYKELNFTHHCFIFYEDIFLRTVFFKIKICQENWDSQRTEFFNFRKPLRHFFIIKKLFDVPVNRIHDNRLVRLVKIRNILIDARIIEGHSGIICLNFSFLFSKIKIQ